jgi:hypothetical protein
MTPEDIHQLSKFLKIVRNYLNMKKALIN